MDQPGIYLYWEGDSRHWYYDLCLKTVLKHNPSARLLNRADVTEVIGPIPRELDRVYIIHRVDWIRKRWVEAVGGLWLDMDFICFQPLDSLAALAGSFDYVGYREWPGNWMDNVFVGKRGSVILRDAADFALDQVRRYGTAVAWLATNAHAIEDAINRHHWGYWMEIPRHLITPVSVVDSHHWFLSDMTPNDDMSGFRCFGFITSFHGLHGWLASQSQEEFLAGPSKLAALFRRALA